jgi:hypothetical protein
MPQATSYQRPRRAAACFSPPGNGIKLACLIAPISSVAPTGSAPSVKRRLSCLKRWFSLRGGFPIEPAQPNHTLIEELERLLEAAQAGEIVGMAGTYVHRDKTVSYSYAGAIASYGMLGGLDCVKERLLRIALSKD